MNRRQKIIVSITGIFIVLLALVGLTYAYFLTQVTGNSNPKSISVTTADLKVEYEDGNGIIEAENLQPMKSNEYISFKTASNGTTNEKNFNIINRGNAKTEYTIVFDEVINEFVNESDIRYVLKNNTTNEEVSGFIRNSFIEGYKIQKIMANIEINKDETHNYSLKLQYLETGKDQSIDMGKRLSFRVNIIGKIDNPTMVLAENAYQQYVISQKDNNNEINETSATTYVKNTLSTAGVDATNVMVFENRGVAGSFVKAINAGAEIGDCINYDSPKMTEESCDWRVLGVGVDGELEITTKVTFGPPNEYDLSKYPTLCNLNSNFTNTYADGYLNGEADLEECAKPFADGKIGLSSRSITVEDVNRVTGYSPMNVGVKDPYNVGTYYEQGNLREYLNNITFAWREDSNYDTLMFVSGTNGIMIEKKSNRYLRFKSTI